MRIQLSVIVVLALTSADAAAQSAASAEADALFDQGRTLLDAGKLAEACAAFDASQKLSSAVTTLFNQANCRERNNQIATAYGLFREAERQTRAPLDEGTQKLNRLAAERAKAIEPRLSKLTFDVPPGHRITGLELRRGDTVVDSGAWGRALPVDGGTITVSARAPGHEAWTTTIEVAAEGDFKSVTIPKLVEKVRPAAVGHLPSKVLPLALAGGAVVLLGGAVGSELLARGDYDGAKREPDDLAQEAQWNGAKTKRYLAQGLAVAGLGCAGVAVWLYLRGRGTEEVAPAARGIRVAPVLAADGAGLQLVGRY